MQDLAINNNTIQKKSWCDITSFEDALKKADIFSKTALVPKAYQNKPADILVAWAKGEEIGLKPLQALQYIAVINGMPSVWGDAIPALIMRSPDYEWHKEFWNAELRQAHWLTQRKGLPVHEEIYTEEMARKAGHLSKDTYKKDLEHMCGIRARARGARKIYADALLGLPVFEEVMDYTDNPKTEISVGKLREKDIERIKNLGLDVPKSLKHEERPQEALKMPEPINVEAMESLKPVANKEKELTPADYIYQLVEQHDLYDVLDMLVQAKDAGSINDLDIKAQREIFAEIKKVVKKKVTEIPQENG